MAKIAALTGLALLAATTGAAVSVAGDYGKQKVVYHINFDDQKKLSGALRNIKNHIEAVGKDNLDLRAVMHGRGVMLLKYAKDDPNFQEKITLLKKQGVTFNVCANSLHDRNINYKKDLWEVKEQDIVPNGIAEIAHLQSQGFTYVKP
jgi:intracellular sulfur oxidation DsrE/DsrF family protein